MRRRRGGRSSSIPGAVAGDGADCAASAASTATATSSADAVAADAPCSAVHGVPVAATAAAKTSGEAVYDTATAPAPPAASPAAPAFGGGVAAVGSAAPVLVLRPFEDLFAGVDDTDVIKAFEKVVSRRATAVSARATRCGSRRRPGDHRSTSTRWRWVRCTAE